MRVLWAHPRLPGVLTLGPAWAVCATAGNRCHVLNAVKQKFQLYKWPLWMGQERAKLNRKRTLCRISPYSVDPTVWGFNVWFWLTGKNWPELKKYSGLSDSWGFGGEGGWWVTQNWECEIVLNDSELNSIHNSSGFLDCKYLQESIHSREKVKCQM